MYGSITLQVCYFHSYPQTIYRKFLVFPFLFIYLQGIGISLVPDIEIGQECFFAHIFGNPYDPFLIFPVIRVLAPEMERCVERVIHQLLVFVAQGMKVFNSIHNSLELAVFPIKIDKFSQELFALVACLILNCSEFLNTDGLCLCVKCLGPFLIPNFFVEVGQGKKILKVLWLHLRGYT